MFKKCLKNVQIIYIVNLPFKALIDLNDQWKIDRVGLSSHYSKMSKDWNDDDWW